MTDPLINLMKSKIFNEACALHDLVTGFRDDNKITCPETIYQCDWVIENAYGFIERLIDIVGYVPEEEEED